MSINHIGNDGESEDDFADLFSDRPGECDRHVIQDNIEGIEDEILALLGDFEWKEYAEHEDDMVPEVTEQEAEEEPAFDDELADNLVDIAAPAPQPNVYQIMNRRAGLEERDRSDALYLIGSGNDDRPVGRMQIMHGATLNIVAICNCGHDTPSPSSSSGQTAKARREGQCRLLLYATVGFMDKYEAALMWLAEGRNLNSDGHRLAADRVKAIWHPTLRRS